MRLRSNLGVRVALGAWAAFSGLNAQAATLPDIAAAFGNTVLATYPDGKAQRIWLHEDGSYDAVGRLGTSSAGRWSLKRDKVCLRQSRPFWVPISYCAAFPRAGTVGATWSGRDLKGVPIVLKLVRGVQKPPAGPGS
jgi:hypothetical protein